MTKQLIALVATVVIVSPLSAQMITQGKNLTWSTNTGQTGTIRISLVSGQYFEAEQTNEKNRAAGIVKLVGAVVDNGRKVVLINGGQWREVWEGSLSEHEINGTLAVGSARFTFRIVEPMAMMNSRNPFSEGRTMKWNSGAGQNGAMRVVSSQGSRFVLEQKNDRNAAAGLTRFEGEFVDGKVTLTNKQWNESWTGMYFNNKVTGKINGRTDFSIFDIGEPTAMVTPRNPFPEGKTMRWTSGAGQNGTLRVVFSSGSRFVIEQKNDRNPAAGLIRFECEILDGRVTLINKQWNETWVGTFINGKVIGKINGRTEFSIFE